MIKNIVIIDKNDTELFNKEYNLEDLKYISLKNWFDLIYKDYKTDYKDSISFYSNTSKIYINYGKYPFNENMFLQDFDYKFDNNLKFKFKIKSNEIKTVKSKKTLKNIINDILIYEKLLKGFYFNNKFIRLNHKQASKFVDIKQPIIKKYKNIINKLYEKNYSNLKEYYDTNIDEWNKLVQDKLN